MRLIDLLKHAPEWDDDTTTLYVARPWTCDAEAILVSPAPDSIEPVEQGGRYYEYFLETFIVREIIGDEELSAEGSCARLIQYAEADA